MNLFGPNDKDTTEKAKAAPEAGRPAKKEVDLFPALADRKTAPIVAPRANVAGPQISMFKPLSFDEALDIVECLRSRSSTTICLESMKKTDASRLVDFVAGASAAIDGDFHKLSEQVYLFCPSNVKIVASAKGKPTDLTKNLGALDFLADATFGNKTTLSNLWSKT